MKRIIFVLVAMFCSIISGTGASCAPKFYDNVPLSYKYSYSGMTAHPIDWYSVKAEEGGVTISYSHNGPEITVIKAPSDLLERIRDIAKGNKLYKLESSYLPKFKILDGYGWFVFIEYPDGYISSGGSNAWPPSKLSAGISAINKLITDIIESAAPEDVLRHEMH